MRYVTLLLLLVACSNSTAPQGPNFVAQNDGAEAARFVLLGAVGDTLFDQVIAIGARRCETFHSSGISGRIYLSADTLTATPFYSTTEWADILIVKSGPTLIQTRSTNTGC